MVSVIEVVWMNKRLGRTNLFITLYSYRGTFVVKRLR